MSDMTMVLLLPVIAGLALALAWDNMRLRHELKQVRKHLEPLGITWNSDNGRFNIGWTVAEPLPGKTIDSDTIYRD